MLARGSGSTCLPYLRERGLPVRAFTRDPGQPKARALAGHRTEVVRGDMEDEASLTRAMDGVYSVYSVQDWQQAGIEGRDSPGRPGRKRREALEYLTIRL